MKKRVFSLMLALAMLLTCAASAETTKHERVFAVVGADGTALSVIDSVRLDNADALDTITDKTALTDVENVGGHEAFTQDGENIVWQAAGKSITYQGNSSEALFVTPVLTVTADGAEVTDLSKLNGSVTVTVNYQVNKDAPYLAVSALLLDPEKFSDVSADNAVVMEEGSREFLVGYAVPGADSTIGLPDHFSFTATCTDADLSGMYTVVTAQPIKALAKELTDKTADGTTLANTLSDCLTALRDGKDMPEGDAKVTDVFAAIATLRDGASQLADGASSLSDGAAQLQTGLTTLTDNNDALNQGAAQVFATTLTTVNAQLATAGLDAAGITLPELTADNYAQVLQGVLDQLNPETLKEQATAAASEKVRAAVEKQKDQVVAGVTQVVQAKVLEGVLTAAGLTMTAEQYEAAAKAGKVTSEQSQQIDAAVKAQMATDEVKAQLDAAVEQQIEALVAQNVAADDVQKQINDAIAPARTAYDSISALKTQLDSLNTFVTGIATYTAGVASASEGAARLTDGSKQLAEGSAQLSQGVADGLAKIVDALLPTLTNDVLPALTTWSATADSASALGGYDLAADGMAQDLVFIIRTDTAK